MHLVLLRRNQHGLQQQSLWPRQRVLDASGAISGNQRGHQWQSAWPSVAISVASVYSASSPQTAGSRDACIKLSMTQRGGRLPSERSKKGRMNTGEKSRMISSTYLMRHAIRGRHWPSVALKKPPVSICGHDQAMIRPQ
mgnify:CR=1 FL=1